ncbi:MAG: CvpA family protein [Anaerolineaceae bacterium]|nr:MAG: CvpA family protein [Anaerolineaceae bacterium]
MIQLSVFMWAMILLFGYIGFVRGLSKELISSSGIILGLFALFQFDDVINDLLISVPDAQAFVFRALIFAVIVFFAYQTRALIGEDAKKETKGSTGGGGRGELQANALGALLGGVNGYLIWGTLWYFMHINDYPLAPGIVAPLQGTASADFVSILPLFVLGGGPTGDGNLLAALVIVVFLIVLIVI